MHKSYVIGEYRWPKTLSSALNVIVNWKWGNRPTEEKYEYKEGVTLTTKVNIGRFRGG